MCTTRLEMRMSPRERRMPGLKQKKSMRKGTKKRREKESRNLSLSICSSLFVGDEKNILETWFKPFFAAVEFIFSLRMAFV